MRFKFEKIGITSDYYIIDSTVKDWEKSIVAVVNGFDNVKALLDLLNNE